MKVFMVHEDPWNAGNPFISTLIEGIQKSHPDCTMAWGREKFWSDEILSYDIVHFHWPQTFMGKDSHTETDFLRHIERMKSCGVKIVATCHDLEPHYNHYSEKAQSMIIVFSHCDAIFHMGAYSKELFESRYKNAIHILVPHHLYDTVYSHFPSRKEALDYLHLPEDRTYILVFGSFRVEKEKKLIISLSKQLSNKNVTILAPSFMSVWWHSFRMPHKMIKRAYYKFRYNIICTGAAWCAVTDDDLPYYFSAADVVFIQRLKILNSGNAVMPMLFGKVVVGPDCGNVGPLLRQWGYPVFSVDNTNNLGTVVENAIEMGKSGIGVTNQPIQFREYSTAVISEKLYEAYRYVINM
jgi:hypothetical protein